MAIAAITAGVQAVSNVIGSLGGIGSGRREADQIVPVQETLDQVFATVVRERDAGADLFRLRQLRDWMINEYTTFITWLEQTAWVDGRAAQQAARDETAEFNRLLTELDAAISAKESSPGISLAGLGSFAPGISGNAKALSLIAITVGFLWLVFRR